MYTSSRVIKYNTNMYTFFDAIKIFIKTHPYVSTVDEKDLLRRNIYSRLLENSKMDETGSNK